jgi:hypothetical protein
VLDRLVGIVLVRAAFCMVMMRHTFPMHQGMFGLSGFARPKRQAMTAAGKGLAEDKQQKKGGDKPTHGMESRSGRDAKNYTGCWQEGPRQPDHCKGHVPASTIT